MLGRAVETGDPELGETAREAAGVETGAAAEFEQGAARSRCAPGPEGGGDAVGVVAEEPFATESVEPGGTVEEARRLGLARHVLGRDSGGWGAGRRRGGRGPGDGRAILAREGHAHEAQGWRGTRPAQPGGERAQGGPGGDQRQGERGAAIGEGLREARLAGPPPLEIEESGGGEHDAGRHEQAPADEGQEGEDQQRIPGVTRCAQGEQRQEEQQDAAGDGALGIERAQPAPEAERTEREEEERLVALRGGQGQRRQPGGGREVGGGEQPLDPAQQVEAFPGGEPLFLHVAAEVTEDASADAEEGEIGEQRRADGGEAELEAAPPGPQPAGPEEGGQGDDGVKLGQGGAGEQHPGQDRTVGEPRPEGQQQEADRHDIDVAAVCHFEDEQRVPGVEQDPLGTLAQPQQQPDQHQHRQQVDAAQGELGPGDAIGVQPVERAEEPLGDRGVDRDDRWAIDVLEDRRVAVGGQGGIGRGVAVGVDALGLDAPVPDVAVDIVRGGWRLLGEGDPRRQRDEEDQRQGDAGGRAAQDDPPRREAVDGQLRQHGGEEGARVGGQRGPVRRPEH